MSSLQEQLLKAGLVDQQKLARANKDKNRQANLARKQHGKKSGQPVASRPQAQDKKAQRDRELNQKRKQEAQRRELAAQAKHLIDTNRQDRAQGEHPYSFVYRGKVKKIYVTEMQRKQLVGGQLAIVTCVTNDGRKFELVPQAVAEKIIERDATLVVDLGQSSKTDESKDDPYADYQVPDDLIW